MPKQALYFSCINPEIWYKIQVIVFHIVSSSLMVACTWQRLLEERQWNLMISFLSVVRVCIFMKRWLQLSGAPTSADVCESTGVIRTPELQVVAWSCPRDCSSHCPWCLSTVILLAISSVQFSSSVVPDSLRPHEPQHARPPCPSPTPRVHPNPCPLSRWCHPAISSSIVPFSSCPQSLPGSGSFQMSQLFTWDGQSIGFSASTSVLPMNTQDWSPLGWTGWTSLQSKGLSRVFSKTTVQKHQFFGFLYSPILTTIHDH